MNKLLLAAAGGKQSIPWTGDFFAGGGANKLFTSKDGATWEDKATTVWYPRNIAFNGSIYVSVDGQGAGIRYSYDLVNWVYKAVGNGDYLWSVAYGNGKFVAIGAYNKVAYSTDGINWTAGNYSFGTGALNNYSPRISVTFVNGFFVVCVSAAQYCVSTDGVSWWKSAWIDASAKNCVAYGDGKYIIGSSNNALAITTSLYVAHTIVAGPAGAGISSIAYGNGMWVAGTFSNRHLYSSPDGINWTLRDSSAAGGSDIAVVFKNGMFVAANSQTVRVSLDGITWTKFVGSQYDFSFII